MAYVRRQDRAHISVPAKASSAREKRVVRLRDKDKLTFPEIGLLLGVTHQRASQIYASASAKLKDVSENGSDALLLLPTRVRTLLKHCGISSRALAISAIKSGELSWQDRMRCFRWQGKIIPKAGKRTWTILYKWAGKPVLRAQPMFVRGYPPNGLSSRANDCLKRFRIPVTKAAVILALNAGILSLGKRDHNRSTYTELCRWAGVDPATLKPC
jgi:hypothetical protein